MKKVSEYFNWSGKENICKEVILSWDLNNLVEKRVCQMESVANQRKSSVAGMSLASSRDEQKITGAKVL